MARLVDLDDVLLSPATTEAWAEVASRIVPALVKMGIAKSDIPIEQARVEKNGDLTIFVSIRDQVTISLTAPADHWKWRTS
jgi:hypothetical protein